MKQLTIKVFKLHFNSPVHFADQKDDYSNSQRILHSDSLHAALVSVLSKTGFNIPQDGELGFNISSLFPFYQKDAESIPIYFLPKPIWHRVLPKENYFLHKKIKKLQWIDVDLFHDLLQNTEQMVHYAPYIKGSFLTKKILPHNGFVESKIVQRLYVPRFLSGSENQIDPKPFFMDRLFFGDFSGLWCMSIGTEKALDLLRNAFKILQDEGIGTDRNIGNGLFHFSEDIISLELPESNHFYSISLLIPDINDIKNNNAQLSKRLIPISYQILKRGGWITTPPFNTLRKNNIYAFSEGSIFESNTSSELMVHGRLVDLTPEAFADKIGHKIFRNGKAILIPVKLS